MAALRASSLAAAVGHAALVPKGPVGGSSSPVLGLPQIGIRFGGVRCSATKAKTPEQRKGGGVSPLAVVASVMGASGPALALVDERMSTEGTGLPFGLSDNLLGWIIFVTFGLIWSLYFVYTSTLEEDEESGLSL